MHSYWFFIVELFISGQLVFLVTYWQLGLIGLVTGSLSLSNSLSILACDFLFVLDLYFYCFLYVNKGSSVLFISFLVISVSAVSLMKAA